MSELCKALARHRADPSGRRWVFVAYDQLTSAVGPLAEIPVRELGIVLVEAPAKASNRPYHRQKLALVLANLRHFAVEQASRGVAVHHVVSSGSYADALEALPPSMLPLLAMVPAERELRRDLEGLVRAGKLRYVPNATWATTHADFVESQGEHPPYRMDVFYKHVRKRTGILMEGGKPAGGKFSFDAENRKRWPGSPPAPRMPRFEPDAITREVCDLVATRFAHHPGTLRPEMLPATQADAERLWEHAKRESLPHFGPFEDAISVRSRRLFHTSISGVLNLSRLLPMRLVREAAELPVPLPSREGFVRQILGWRELVRHVHEATDGFRRGGVPTLPSPGDGGYRDWSGKAWGSEGARVPSADGGACPSHVGASAGVPPAYWGATSGLACLDAVVEAVWDEGYSHHITRLMVLSNIATLLDVSPRALTDWFWVAYVDAYDWVVEPNVLAMGTYGAGGVMTTKPYIAGAAYIHKMGDACDGCAFDPKRTCPLTRLYWAYLKRHQASLTGSARMMVPLAALRKRSLADTRRDEEVFERTREALARGERLVPED